MTIPETTALTPAEVLALIPESLSNMKLPDPELKTFYEQDKHRIIWLDSEVTSYSLEIIRKITEWNRRDYGKPITERVPIKIFFFSPGGDLNVNYAIIDTIRISKTPVIGINTGLCASSAAFIYLTCHKRYMFENATFLFHQGSGTLSGSFGEICAGMADYQESVNALSKHMATYTKYSEEEITENITNEWYVRKEEALEKGVCDAIVTDMDIFFSEEY